MPYNPIKAKRERQKICLEIIKEVVDKEVLLIFIILAGFYLFDNAD